LNEYTCKLRRAREGASGRSRLALRAACEGRQEAAEGPEAGKHCQSGRRKSPGVSIGVGVGGGRWGLLGVVGGGLGSYGGRVYREPSGAAEGGRGGAAKEGAHERPEFYKRSRAIIS
jgi:hypothetical protein